MVYFLTLYNNVIVVLVFCPNFVMLYLMPDFMMLFLLLLMKCDD